MMRLRFINGRRMVIRIWFVRDGCVQVRSPFFQHRMQFGSLFRMAGRKVAAFSCVGFQIVQFKPAIFEIFVKLPFTATHG